MIKIIPTRSIILASRPFVELSIEKLDTAINRAISLLNQAETISNLDKREAMVDRADAIAKAVRVELINRN